MQRSSSGFRAYSMAEIHQVEAYSQKDRATLLTAADSNFFGHFIARHTNNSFVAALSVDWHGDMVDAQVEMPAVAITVPAVIKESMQKCDDTKTPEFPMCQGKQRCMMISIH